EVMLTERVELDVLHNHHVVVLFHENGIVQDRLHILTVSLGKEPERLCRALGGGAQPLSGGILADRLQESRKMRLDAVLPVADAHATLPRRSRRRRSCPSRGWSPGTGAGA